MIILLLIPFGVISIAYIVFLITKNPSVIDAFWAPGLVVLATVLYLLSPRQFGHHIVWLITLVWAIRLTLFILVTRLLKKQKDRRYENLLKTKNTYNFLKTVSHYALQAVLQLIVGTVFAIAFSQSLPLTTITLLGAVISIIGIAGESLADWQVYQHKKTSQDICQTGLWAYSRHPNYFFEILVWLGLALSTQQFSGAWVALVSPLTVWIILRYMSGPFTESLSLAKYGKTYEDYKRRTPMIFPDLRRYLTKRR